MAIAYVKNQKPSYLSRMFGYKINPFNSRDEADNSDSNLWYIRVHTNIWAWLLVFPYYFKYDYEKGTHQLQKNSWHTRLCILTSVALAFQSFEDIKELRNLINNVKQIPEAFSYFIIAEELSLAIYCVFILITIWLKSGAFIEVVDFLQLESKYNAKIHLSIKRKILFIIYNICTSLGPPLLLLLNQISDSSWNLTQLFEKYYNSFFETIYLNPREFSNPSPVVFGAVVTFKIITEIGSLLAMAFSDWSVITYTILLYWNVVEYANLVRNPASSTDEIKHSYEHLKSFSKKLGNWLGLAIFGLTLGSFPFFVSKFYDFVQPRNVGNFLTSVYSIGTLMTTLIVGAMIDKRARVTKEWLSDPKHYRAMPSNELQVLLSEVQDCEIGIYGLDLFKFTPGLLGSVLSLLVTFAVIMLQFKGSNV